MIIELTKKDIRTLKFSLDCLVEAQQDSIDHSKLYIKLCGMS